LDFPPLGIESESRVYVGFSEVLSIAESPCFLQFLTAYFSMKAPQQPHDLRAGKVTGKPNAGPDFQGGDGNPFSRHSSP
jgi:hypothetical protein